MIYAFLAFALLSVIGALGVLLETHPVRGALWLLLSFLGIGILYLLAAAPFLGFVQIIVYAGAVVVLFLVAIAVMNLRRLPDDRDLAPRGFLAVLFAGALFFVVLALLRHAPVYAVAPVPDGSPGAIALALFHEYLVPFELVSLLLLVAIVGAIVLMRRRPGP